MTPTAKDLIKKNFLPGARIAIFADAANLSATTRGLDFFLDYALVRDLFAECGRLLRCFYYCGMRPDHVQDPQRKLVDWLTMNGWTTVTKPFKYQGDHGSNYTVKGNLDVEIAVDMIRFSQYVDDIVLFSGDGDFSYLVKHLQERGKRVIVVSTRSSKAQCLSLDLLKQADGFIDLETLRPYCSRDAKDRMRASLLPSSTLNPESQGEETTGPGK